MKADLSAIKKQLEKMWDNLNYQKFTDRLLVEAIATLHEADDLIHLVTTMINGPLDLSNDYLIQSVLDPSELEAVFQSKSISGTLNLRKPCVNATNSYKKGFVPLGHTIVISPILDVFVHIQVPMGKGPECAQYIQACEQGDIATIVTMVKDSILKELAINLGKVGFIPGG